MDFGGQVAKFIINEKVLRVGQRPETDAVSSAVESDDDDEFTTKIGALKQGFGEEESSSESAVVVTTARSTYKNDNMAGEAAGKAKQETLVSKKLEHLDYYYFKNIRTELIKQYNLAWSLDYYSTVDVSTWHFFELTESRPSYHAA